VGGGRGGEGRATSDEEIGKLDKGSMLIGFLAPLAHPEVIEKLDAAGVTAFAVESIPRISRAQSMDALSSQANVAGYKSVLLAADQSTRFFPMLTTAAGTVKPAMVLVLGVGVAGLQALATAKRLGARTTGTTCGRMWPTRCGRWARSGWTWGSRRPVRAATRAS